MGDETPKASILLADDDPDLARSWVELFRREGYSCDWVGDVPAAVAALRERRYDLLLADLKMPGNEHLEIVTAIAALGRLVPTVFVTGYPTLPTALAALRSAVLDYLVKPLSFPSLLDSVKRAIERGRAQRALRDGWELLSRWAQGGRDAPTWSPATAGRAREGGTTAAAPAGGPETGLPPEASRLSPREQEVLQALSQGRRTGEIAGLLHISLHTVRNHLKAILRKLGAHSQIELVARLARRPPPPPAQ